MLRGRRRSQQRVTLRVKEHRCFGVLCRKQALGVVFNRLGDLLAWSDVSNFENF